MGIFRRRTAPPKGHQKDSPEIDVHKKDPYFSFEERPGKDYIEAREQSRKIINESTIARSISRRITDHVVNTGLTWESSPVWEMIKDAPSSDDERQALCTKIENLWKLYAGSTGADLKGQYSFGQLQYELFTRLLQQGEFFVILRYLSDPQRINPCTLQILNNDQIKTPFDSGTEDSIRANGGDLIDGIEYSPAGDACAIWIEESPGSEMIRIPFFGKSGRRFVIHCSNSSGRGISEFSGMAYDLTRLADYDEAELEAVVASSKFFAAVTADKDVLRAPSSGLKLAGMKTQTSEEMKSGIKQVDINNTALIIDTLPPGYDFKGFQPTRPNQNYEKYMSAKETRLCGMMGLPLSVYTQAMSKNYSAARAEILLFWNSVEVRRAWFVSGFLKPFFKAVFSEWVSSGQIQAPGFGVPGVRDAWLYGSWNGIARPVIDPVKEVKAIRERIQLGHSTGEREAKAYNGSDFIENVNRLKYESEQLEAAGLSINAQPSAEAGREKETEEEDGE